MRRPINKDLLELPDDREFGKRVLKGIITAIAIGFALFVGGLCLLSWFFEWYKP